MFFSNKNRITNKYLPHFKIISFASNGSCGWIIKFYQVWAVRPDCPSSQELLSSFPRVPLAGTDLPAHWGYRVLSFVFLWLQILQCVIYPSPIPRIHDNLNSLKYYSHSPWTARYKNKDISKQPPNPTGQVPQILKEKNTHFAVGQAKSIRHALHEIYKDWHTWCAHTINLHTHAHIYTTPPALLLYTVKSCII